MDKGFARSNVSFLDTALQEVQNTEQTQEIRIPDGMPDVGRIVSSWGQVILRGKEWRGDTVSCNGGMMVWVLYAPEDGSSEQCIDVWIPFQMYWDVPEGTPEGEIRIRLLNRFVDARTVSPRKIMVRAGIAGFAETFVPGEAEIYSSESAPAGVEVLQNTYPVRINKEAGEKTFSLEEELTLPDSIPVPETILYYHLEPKVAEKKVISNKVVFRGKGELHVLYRSEEGQLHSWDFEMPFSQFAQLKEEYGPDAQADMAVVPVELGLDLDGEGHLHFKGNLTGQYVISDKTLLTVAEDAYSPERQVTVETQTAEVPAILEQRRENIYGEQSLNADANIAVDSSFLPDFPRQRRMDGNLELEFPGTFQVLYYGEDGVLHSGTARWEGRHNLPAGQEPVFTAAPQQPQVHTMLGNGQITMKLELPVEMTAATRQQMQMVTGAQLGDPVKPDPNRPTLILRRAGEDRLWDVAKRNGTTVEAIRRANQLSEEPVPGQMLLIPIP